MILESLLSHISGYALVLCTYFLIRLLIIYKYCNVVGTHESVLIARNYLNTRVQTVTLI